MAQAIELELKLEEMRNYEEQIKMLSIAMPVNNYRDIQPLNGRKINKIMPLATN